VVGSKNSMPARWKKSCNIVDAAGWLGQWLYGELVGGEATVDAGGVGTGAGLRRLCLWLVELHLSSLQALRSLEGKLLHEPMLLLL